MSHSAVRHEHARLRHAQRSGRKGGDRARREVHRNRKEIAYTWPPAASVSEAAKRDWFAESMRLEGKDDTYSEKGYVLAAKRARRDRDKDNAGRAARR